MMLRLRKYTVCRWPGWHGRLSKGTRRYDGGKLPVLCPACHLIIGRWEPRQGQHYLYSR
jgi:hypothetical protein